MTKVMIGGIKTPEDATMATELGADAIGFLVEAEPTSADAVRLSTAREIIEARLPYSTAVLSTHLMDPSEIVEITAAVKPNAVHIYGGLNALELEWVKRRMSHIMVLRAMRVTGEEAIDQALQFSKLRWLDGIVLDTMDRETGQVGGTGVTHDWEISRYIVTESQMPVTLAGGLSIDNIVKAIGYVRPYAVDVSSGVRADNGQKDPYKVNEFITSAHHA
jgi:phosphoribosylanthranilate isomerase